jgi:hypothetical protein
VERWQVAPASKRFRPAAKFLPGQLDRIRNTEFAGLEETKILFRGAYDFIENQTLGFRLKNVDLVDGVLYSQHATRHLRQRGRRWPAYLRPPGAIKGVIYESWLGNAWFGAWLTNDCLTYPLAEEFGTPVTTHLTSLGHVPSYEERLGMRPLRTARAHFDELVLFEDLPNNDHKRARAHTLRTRLLSGIDPAPHPGVFILRGTTGSRRVLKNERQIADAFATKYGFRILDHTSATVPEIVAACAGARIVAGVEGSQLVHGMMVMPLDATLFAIQPAERAVGFLKLTTDRQGQGYALVVAEGGQDEFTASWEEIERTMDLIHA